MSATSKNFEESKTLHVQWKVVCVCVLCVCVCVCLSVCLSVSQ